MKDPGTDKHQDQLAVQYGGFLAAVVAAASFTAILTLAGLQRTDVPAQWAMFAFTFALPPTAYHALVARDPIDRHDPSWISRLLTVFGFIAFFFGLSVLIGMVSEPASSLFVVLGIVMVAMGIRASKRADKRKAKAASEKVALPGTA